MVLVAVVGVVVRVAVVGAGEKKKVEAFEKNSFKYFI